MNLKALVMERTALVTLLCLGAIGLQAVDFSSTDYVTSGLVGHWDGIENGGRGLHVEGTNYWVDLSGKSGAFQVQTSVAAFVADGLMKNATGFMASNGVVRTDVRTAEIVISGAPSSGWVNALLLRNSQTVTFNNNVASANGQRFYFFDYKHFGWATESKPAQETVTVFFNVWNGGANAASFLQNGVKPAGYGKTDYWTDANPPGMYIGGRAGFPSGGDAKTTGYTIHAVRLYNRWLSMAESRYHVALDRVRFFGASADEVPYTLQDGVPKMRLSAVAEAGGLVAMNDSSSARHVETDWLTLDKSQTYAFRAVPLPGWRFTGWTGDDVADLIVEGTSESPVLLLSAYRNAEIRANFVRDETYPGYVVEGLVGRWDGHENADVGIHDESTTVWKDLSETAGDFLLVTNVARFSGNALWKNAKGVMATNAVARTDVLTMEAVVEFAPDEKQWVNAFFLDRYQTLTFNNNTGVAGSRRQYFVDDDHLGWSTDEQTLPMTLAATYSQSSGKAVGEAIFVNGTPPGTGTASANYWSQGDATGMSLGGRTGASNVDRGDCVAKGYALNAARLYSRKLSAGEVAYNAALDQVRFFGASTNSLAYRLTEAGAVECVLRAWTAGTGGHVSAGGMEGEAALVEKSWRAFGTEDSASFTAIPAEGWTFICWKGDVAAITSGTADSPTIGVTSTRGVALEAVFTSLGRYVADGLVGHWDGIENAGYGHHDANSSVWKDLTEQTGDFALNPVAGNFSDDALLRTRTGRSGQRREKRTDVRTVEVVLSGLKHDNKWVLPVFIDNDQHLTFRDTETNGVRQYFFDWKKTGFATTDMPTNMTLTVTYRPWAEEKAEDCYVNGVVATGEVYTNYWTNVDPMTLGGRNDSFTEAATVGYCIHSVRFYDRVLTPAEIQRNARYDAIRFFGQRAGGTMILFR